MYFFIDSDQSPHSLYKHRFSIHIQSGLYSSRQTNEGVHLLWRKGFLRKFLYASILFKSNYFDTVV